MNITIVRTFTDGFTTYQSGQELSVPSEVAQRWIADGTAQADTDGQQSWLSSTEVAATRALVSGGGTGGADAAAPIGDFLGVNPIGEWRAFYLPSPYDAAEFTGLSAVVQAQLTARGKTDWEALTVTQRKGLTHPSLLYIPGGFSGKRWWCAYTPYPAGDSDFENPCVAASVDGETWEVPDGMDFPIAAAPAIGTSYNSDTHLYFDEPARRLILIYRERVSIGNDKVLLVTLAENSVEWSAPVTIYTGDLASPSIWYDPVISKWVMIGHGLDQAAPWPVYRVESSTLDSGWGNLTTITPAHPVAERAWWHSFVVRQTDGSYIGIASDNTGVSGQPGNLYLWQARDNGLVFSAKKIQGARYVDGLGVTNNYRSSFAPIPGGKVRFLISSVYGPLSFGYGEVGVAKSVREALNNANEFALVSTSPAIAAKIIDDFNRADSLLGVGNDLTGNAWTQGSGVNLVGISGNAAYPINTNSCRIWRDTLSPNHEIAIGVKTLGTICAILVGLVDANNHYRLFMDSTGAVKLHRIVGGAATDLVIAGAGLIANGSIARVKKCGAILSVYIDGDLIYTATDATYATATKAGIMLSGATASFVDWVVARAL